MTTTLKSIFKNLISIHQHQRIPFVLLDSKYNLLYANSSFCRSFKIGPKDFGQRRLDFLYTHNLNELIPLPEFSVEELARKLMVVTYQAEHEEHGYYLELFFIGEEAGRGYFYGLVQEATELELQFSEKSLQALIKASLLKDNDTANHLTRVNAYSRLLADYLVKTQRARYPEITSSFIERIGKVAALHDIGKIGTPDSILTKPTDLSPEEFDIVKEHTINGAFILSSLAGEMARDIALFHHERWDGSGYPYNLRRTDIPLCARIVAIADVYDALRMARYYKNPLPHAEAKTIILAERGFYFDPALVDAFAAIHDQFAHIFNTWGDEQEIEVLEELSTI